jgi:dolichol-phosphate mannosyltransferase
MPTSIDPLPTIYPIVEWPDGISLVIPAYNEETRIKSTLESYLGVLRNLGLPFEVIVVVDGSDRTSDVVHSMSEESVRVIRFHSRQGKGGAIIAGFKEAKFRRVGHVDADGSLAPDSLLSLIRNAAEYDCVFGSRWVPGSVWLARETPRKEFAGRVFNAFVRALLGVGVRDTQCGAKFYSQPFLQRLIGHVHVNNQTTDVSFVLHARLLGARCAEIPVTWTSKDGSRFRLLPDAITMFSTVAGMRIANSRVHALVPDRLTDTIHRVVEWVQ